MELVYLWIRIVAVIIAWEVWKWIAWEIIDKWINYQVKQHSKKK